MASIALPANQDMLIDMIQQSLASTEEYVYLMLTSAVLPTDCKITMHQFRTTMHTNLANITAHGSASLLYMNKTCNPHRHYKGLRCLLHKANLPVTGDKHNNALALTNATARVEAFYFRPDNTINLAGPFRQLWTSSAKYAFIVTDHYTRYVWVDFIASKSTLHTAHSF